jgi:predicted dinucleotide-binding enzyme
LRVTLQAPKVLRMATIGIIGSGKIGSQVARLAIQSGYDVVLSNSRGPETLAALVQELGPKARAGTVQDAAQSGDEIVVVSIPLGRFRTVPVEPLVGKIVIDTNNYYPQRDGNIPELQQETATSLELLQQQHLPKSKVVKGFNHIQAAQWTTDGSASGTPNRRALAIAGDDLAAKAKVTALLDEFGFDTVDAGTARDSWRIQPGTPGYGPRRNAEQLRADLASAERPQPAR